MIMTHDDSLANWPPAAAPGRPTARDSESDSDCGRGTNLNCESESRAAGVSGFLTVTVTAIGLSESPEAAAAAAAATTVTRDSSTPSQCPIHRRRTVLSPGGSACPADSDWPGAPTAGPQPPA